MATRDIYLYGKVELASLLEAAAKDLREDGDATITVSPLEEGGDILNLNFSDEVDDEDEPITWEEIS